MSTIEVDGIYTHTYLHMCLTKTNHIHTMKYIHLYMNVCVCVNAQI